MSSTRFATLLAVVSSLYLVELTRAQNAGYATYSNGGGGVCSSVSSGLPKVAMNAAQFGGGDACGKCVQIQGTGNGAGSTPVSTAPYIAVINNICPQCAPGDIDLQENGSGKFGITWSFVACPGSGRRLIEGGRKMIAEVEKATEELKEVIDAVEEETAAVESSSESTSVTETEVVTSSDNETAQDKDEAEVVQADLSEREEVAASSDAQIAPVEIVQEAANEAKEIPSAASRRFLHR